MHACPSCGREVTGSFAFCPHCGAALTASTEHERRKTVTVLFCDVTGSTALGESVDPEAFRALLARYFDRMRSIVEGRGGTVEKFIGDAVMAVFGVPVAHEDDALRAVSAAAAMREALPELGVEGRIGVNTGEVVTGTEERLATGDAVNVAARLEQAARPGEVLLGEETLGLVRGSVDVRRVEPLPVKGKREPVPAYRLLSVGEAPGRRHESRFVGRDAELEQVREALRRVMDEERCELITVVGDPGVGKSRLIEELLSSTEARVFRGRCPPYGEGLTYWPVVEVLKQVDALPSDPVAESALQSLLGKTGQATPPDEIAWAFRKLLEEQAPLVCVFDDIQWGEDTFLDLIEHVALLSTGAAILLVCLARPELTERRPQWPVSVRLEPLPQAAVGELIPKQLGDDLRQRIARAAGGNPLFVTEMVAIAAGSDGDVPVPPTLKALLAARLDQLEADERSVLERGAVEGEVFHRGAVQALDGGDPVIPRLAALVRRNLIRPDKALFRGEDAFRFSHLLIRDAAYEALPKSTRADLHERYAAWLERSGGDLVELDEVVAFHLEQAVRYRAELGWPDDGTLSEKAMRLLAAAGYRAARRQDYGAAVRLLERAAALLPRGEIDLALEMELTNALFWMGRSNDARQRADRLADRAAAGGDEIEELCARILRARFEGIDDTELVAVIDEALPVFEAAGDDLALYIAYDALADASGTWAAGLEALEHASTHARNAGHDPANYLGFRAGGRFFGTTRASQLLAWLDDNEPAGRHDHFLAAYRAGALAMLTRFDEARAILAASRAELTQRGPGILLANITGFESVWVELWAGDPAAALEFGLEAWNLYLELGEQSFARNAAANIAQAYYELDRLDDAEAWSDRGAQDRTDQDDSTYWRHVKAKVLALRGEHAKAERLAREAIQIADEKDTLNAQGDAYLDFAEVLAAAGRVDKAAEALGEALERYARKENLAMVARVQDRLGTLRTPA